MLVGWGLEKEELRRTPCIRWQVVQWQYLEASGFSRLSSYCTAPQWHLPFHLGSKSALS
jgi:hypothetical protein